MLDTSSNHKKETNYLLRQNMEAISTEFYWTINFDQGVSAFLLKYILPNDPSRCILKSALSYFRIIKAISFNLRNRRLPRVLEGSIHQDSAPCWNWKGWIANSRGTLLSLSAANHLPGWGIIQIEDDVTSCKSPYSLARVLPGCLLPSLLGPCSPFSLLSKPFSSFLHARLHTHTAQTHTHNTHTPFNGALLLPHMHQVACIVCPSLWLLHRKFQTPRHISDLLIQTI